jgi:hypothetical protein
MSQDSKTARRRWPAKRRLSASLSGIALLVLAGCANPGRPSGNGYDPLIGGQPLTSSPSARARGVVPPGGDPAPSTDRTATSAAALAVGNRSNDDRGNDDRDGPAQGVNLGAPRTPENRGPVTPVTPAGKKTPAGPVSLDQASYEQLQELLQTRGVVWQQLKTVMEGRGEWLFVCAIPDPGTPGMQRQYEGRAADEHGLAAIRAVLKDIDNTLKQRGDK